MNTIKKYYKYILGAIGAILLGAISSGVWEHLLKPLAISGSNLLVEVISLLSLSFKDDAYATASLGFTTEYSIKTFFLLAFGIFYLLLVIIYFAHKTIQTIKHEKDEDLATRETGFLNKKTLILVLFFIAISSIMVFQQAQDLYSFQVKTWSLSSLERIRGSISVKEYNVLRSKFYLVDSSEDYYEFYEELLRLAKESNVKLRSFSPL